MGHERVGYLPRTKKWRDIVNNIGNFSSSNNNINEIAFQTLKNVRKRFDIVKNDSGFQAAIRCLVILSVSGKEKNPDKLFESYDLDLQENYNLFDLTNAAASYIAKHKDSNEYATIATQSLIDTIAKWYQKNSLQGTILFADQNNQPNIWQQAGTGSGFCELSRLYFAKFTERYLKYFLEREVAYNIDNLYDRSQFNKNLSEHINDITKHAFETSKITESFSAGWFNKNCTTGIPSDDIIKGFISFSMQKVNSELLREEGHE